MDVININCRIQLLPLFLPLCLLGGWSRRKVFFLIWRKRNMSYITYSYLTEKMKKGKMRTSLNINQGKLGGGMVWYSQCSEVRPVAGRGAATWCSRAMWSFKFKKNKICFTIFLILLIIFSRWNVILS